MQIRFQPQGALGRILHISLSRRCYSLAVALWLAVPRRSKVHRCVDGYPSGIDHQVIQSRVRASLHRDSGAHSQTGPGHWLVPGSVLPATLRPSAVHDGSDPIAQAGQRSVRAGHLDAFLSRAWPPRPTISTLPSWARTPDHQTNHAHITLQRGADRRDRERKEPSKGNGQAGRFAVRRVELASRWCRKGRGSLQTGHGTQGLEHPVSQPPFPLMLQFGQCNLWHTCSLRCSIDRCSVDQPQVQLLGHPGSNLLTMTA